MQLRDDLGPIVLTDATSVTLKWSLKDGDGTVHASTCTITDAALGKIRFVPAADTFLVPGAYDIQVKIMYNTIYPRHVPNRGFGTLIVEDILPDPA